MIDVELFPCAGGMAEGARRAGFHFSWAFDMNPNACASYEANLGHRPICMDVADLLRLLRGGVAFPPVRLLVADPPCTPWSRAGKREGLDDERDMLLETAQIIALLRPEVYLIGNVPGLQDASNWHVVQNVIGGLSRLGYCVADYAQLDAADYGVPQHRVRPFWFGHLAGPCLRWPAPTHGQDPAPVLPGFPQLLPYVTCRDALSHLPPEELGRRIRQRANSKHPPSPVDGASNTITAGGSRHQCNTLDKPDWWYRKSDVDGPSRAISTRQNNKLTGGGHPDATPDAPAPTIRSGGDGHSAPQVVLRAPTLHDTPHSQRLGDPDEPGRTLTCNPARSGVGPGQVLAWPWDRPATTVTTRDAIPPPGHHPEEGSILSVPNAVALSERAAALLQGFPEGWRFVGATKTERWSQLGQAMPPGLAAPVFVAIAEQIERTPSPCRRCGVQVLIGALCNDCIAGAAKDLRATAAEGDL
jgi:site-specific DNA-cytosine methylase